MKSGFPIPTEHDIQSNFFSEVSLRYRLDPSFRPILLYAVLNGAWIAGNGQGKSALLDKYKAEGWKSGIADVHYDQPRGPFSKLVIEFKRESKRRAKRAGVMTGGLDPEQVEYLQAIAPYALVKVCYTEDEALSAFSYYMSLGQSLLPGIQAREEVELWSVAAILGEEEEEEHEK